MRPKAPRTASQEAFYQAVELDPLEAPADDDLTEANPRGTASHPEFRKAGVQKDRPRSFRWALILLCPVAVSFGILSLTFRTFYWRDAQSSGTEEVLGVLQVAAKAHEILIIFSLSRIVLYYLRVLLSSQTGLPFGLFASGYSHTLGQAPTALGFWTCLISTFWKKRTQWKTLLFGILIILSTLIGLTAGPASAIALIPQLNWWHQSDLFYFAQSGDRAGCSHSGSRADFSLYTTKPLFPLEVNATSLPGSFCLNASLDIDSVCPYQGLEDLASKFNWTGLSNFTVGTDIGRVIAATMPPSSTIDAILPSTVKSWTTNQVLTDLMSEGVVLAGNGPLMSVETRIFSSESVPSPLVNASCEVRPSTDFDRNLTFLVNPSYLDPESFDTSTNHLLTGTFDIRDIWDEGTLKDPPMIQVQWKEFPNTNGNPILSAFILMPKGTQDSANVSMCSVYATWVPSQLYLLPSQSNNAISNFTFTSYENLNYPDPDQRYDRPIFNLRKDWADGLNAENSTSNSTTLATFIHDGMGEYQSHVSRSDPGYPGLGLSLMLSAAVSNGLAAIGLEFSQNMTACRGGWCSQGPFYTRSSGYTIFNGTGAQAFDACEDNPLNNQAYPVDQDHEDLELLRSFKKPSESFVDAQWTKISFPVFKYGYGWSFNTTTIKIATAVLMVHALVIIIHVCYTIISARSYTYASDLAELLALALESRPTETFTPASINRSKGEVWKRPTAVRKVDRSRYEADKLELVVSSGFERSGAPKKEEVVEDEYM